MKKHVLNKLIKLESQDADDLYSLINGDWEYKAKRLIARRWRALKMNTKPRNIYRAHI